ncbi:hypothetical protein [Dermatophilus congolensis]|uniref:Uncharacterized protein n=1 Tax=Dermatophilus congolensis TaxID=1863 RepID=A0A239V366_9MICO|nr:hypothetical protein [Dermatophilus congolensis]MBO3130115.1 hypothetical protein [Dermatophilus congolensis]MBO3131258.1 hypothetical protein [Dermatophilus congolensis]MBO3134586.1 hypothetical protein [Dermatophilus congolensis]MBO3136823.1 hypothetical protein [Dermatophilus congolensis]MBO3139067.1 hypothetical protein [Dermatophilus congolensis]
MHKRSVARVAGAGLTALALMVTALPTVHAAPESNGSDPSTGNITTPNTPDNNPLLPLVNVKRPNTRLKPNIFNPHPVCNAHQDYRTVIYRVQDHFTPMGAIETRNDSKGDIPLSQQLSRTQTISLSVSGDYGKTFGNISSGLSAVVGKLTGNISATSPTESLNIRPSVSYSLAWTVGQTIGPFNVPAGHTGKATYGFRQLSFKGTQQRCRANGTWSNPWTYSGLAPLSNAVVVKVYKNSASEATGTK